MRGISLPFTRQLPACLTQTDFCFALLVTYLQQHLAFYYFTQSQYFWLKILQKYSSPSSTLLLLTGVEIHSFSILILGVFRNCVTPGNSNLKVQLLWYKVHRQKHGVLIRAATYNLCNPGTSRHDIHAPQV